MTVAELIDLLKKMPQDAAVYANGLVVGVEHDEFFNCVDIHAEER